MIWGGPVQSLDAGEAYFELKGVVYATLITVMLYNIQKTLVEIYLDIEIRLYLA
jgi:hypothetical protein